MQEERYWEWLCSIPGIYRMQQEILLRVFHTPEGVWQAEAKEFEYLNEKGCRWIAKVQNYRKETAPEKTVHTRQAAGIQFISHTHPDYPKRLRVLPDHPYGLFFRGKLPEEERHSVAIVGARMCTRAGKEMAERLAGAVARAGGIVVSGGAYGIDGAAQWFALESGGDSFAVLGCGAEGCYPSSHSALFERLSVQGGVISEFPVGTRPFRHHFPMRNRIISGLADDVIVVEARQKSGSLITAGFALEQGKNVLAVPGRPEDELSAGCNKLISQGADILFSVDMYIKSAFPEYNSENKKLWEEIALAPAEKLVYSNLGFCSKSLWELEECTALSLAALSSSLLSLELKGLIKETGHNYYMRTE